MRTRFHHQKAKGKFSRSSLSIGLRTEVVKWSASSRWSYHPYSEWGSIETMAIAKTQPTLLFWMTPSNSYQTRVISNPSWSIGSKNGLWVPELHRWNFWSFANVWTFIWFFSIIAEIVEMFSVEPVLVKQWYWHRIPNLCEYAIIVIRFFLPVSQLKKFQKWNFWKKIWKRKISKIIVFLSISNAQFNLFKSSSFCIKTVFVQFKIAKTKFF